MSLVVMPHSLEERMRVPMSNSEKCLVIIWGGTGNLTYKKLIPALYSLYLDKALSPNLYFLAIGRKDYRTTDYHQIITDLVHDEMLCDESCLQKFLKQFEYFQMAFDDMEGYIRLKQKIDKLAELYQTEENQIFYFAVSPDYFESISNHMAHYGILNNKGFNRVVFEKPFGKDLKTAEVFNAKLKQIFTEDEIYRIDHYLGKTMIQNILTLRFGNRLFEEVWCNSGIESIHINIYEKEGVLTRGKYYDEFGALRDMVQNHLLQIVALLAMDAPKAFTPEGILAEKLKILRSIKPFTREDLNQHIILGQYEGYTSEPDVNPKSQTETFVQLRLELLTKKWVDVPFVLTTGKALDDKFANIEIVFKENSSGFSFPDTSLSQNKLLIKIQPEEGVELSFNSKIPGLENQVHTVKMDYCQSCQFVHRSPDAYEKLLLDVLSGDKTLFTHWDEIEASWYFIDSIQSECNAFCKPLVIYPKSTKGPRLDDETL